MIISAADKLQYIQEYYFSRKLKEIKALMDAGKDILNLGIGNPDQMPSIETIEALNSSADKSTSHGY